MESVVEPVGHKESKMKQWEKGACEEMQMKYRWQIETE